MKCEISLVNLRKYLPKIEHSLCGTEKIAVAITTIFTTAVLFAMMATVIFTAAVIPVVGALFVGAAAGGLVALLGFKIHNLLVKNTTLP